MSGTSDSHGGIDEDDVRAAYRFLAHEGRGVTEMRVISPDRSTGIVGIGYFDNEGAFVNACKGVNGAGNVYLGIQPRPERFLAASPNRLGQLRSGAKDQDIDWLTAIVLDIDPVRHTGTAATNEELAQAVTCGDRITDWLAAKGYARPVRNMSGNGCQLWFAVPPAEINDGNRDEISQRLKTFEAKVRQRFASEPVAIDSIYNLSRIIKVIGTRSVKGKPTAERPHRMSRSLDPFERVEDERLLESILAMPLKNRSKSRAAKKERPINILPEMSPFMRELLRSDTRVGALFEGRGKPEATADGKRCDTSSSGYDFSLALELAKLNVSPDDIATAIWNRPDGGARRKRDAYVVRTVRQALATVAEDTKPKKVAEREPEKPDIQLNDRQLRNVVVDARTVIEQANERRIGRAAADPSVVRDVPAIFRRSGKVVCLKLQDDQGPHIESLGDTGMFGLLARDANWFVLTEDEGTRAAWPKRQIAQDLIEFPPPNLPQIEMVISAPVFAADGHLLVTPGMHRQERLWLHEDPRLRMAEVPTNPSADDIAKARGLLLDDLLVDFPFVDAGDRAHAVCAVLLPFARRLIRGLTPLHLVEAPTAGSGKGFICTAIAILATGSPCQIKTLPGEEEEVRKCLTAQLRDGRPYVMLDNTREGRVLNSASLAAALTAEVWSDRILGESNMVALPNRALWMMTGNNPQLSDELSRRCVRIRIDTKRDMPWLRSGFKHDPILEWVMKTRSELVHAVLVLIQAWVAAGKPRSSARLGSFEQWAAVMGGILDVIGVPGFLGNLDDLYAGANAERQMWREFTLAWQVRFGHEPKRVGDLNKLCEQMSLMEGLRGDGTERSQQIRLGKALQGVRDRMFGDLRIALARDDGHKGRHYVLIQEGDAFTTAPSRPSGDQYVGDIDPFAEDGECLASPGNGTGMSSEPTSPTEMS